MRDREIILNPESWPLWPFLNLRRVSDGEHGVLVDLPGFERKVFLGVAVVASLPNLLEFIEKAKGSIQYNSVEEILEDWEVD